MTGIRYKYFSPDEQALIRREGLAAEQQGCWTQAMHELAVGRDLFRQMVPIEYGGQQVTLLQGMEIVEEAASLDGSFGWTLSLGMGAGIFSAHLNSELATQVYSTPEAYIGGSGFPGGVASSTQAGFELSGRWKYISGSDIATGYTAAFRLPDSDGEEHIRAVFLTPDQVEIERTWTSYGLVATASHDLVIDSLAVHNDRVFDILPGKARIAAPLYAYPFMSLATAHLAACVSGMALGFTQAAEEVLQERPVPEKEKVGAISWVRRQVERYRQSRVNFFGAVEQTWQQVEQLGEARESDLRAMETLAAGTVKEGISVAQDIYPLLGMAVLPMASRVNRAWRDLLTGSQHSLFRQAR